MKKLLFVLAFTFIGQEVFSQMYMVLISTVHSGGSAVHPSNCSNGANDRIMTTIDPSGNISYICLPYGLDVLELGGENQKKINQEFNTIISQGYKLIQGDENNVLSSSDPSNSIQGTWYFAIPWTSSGLEEVPTTLKSFIISPNPANTLVDISLDYSLKGESEVVFISEAGYISHKQSIGNISKNEKYNIDISKIPAGKYLVTIVNGKTYTTPQKLIIF